MIDLLYLSADDECSFSAGLGGTGIFTLLKTLLVVDVVVVVVEDVVKLRKIFATTPEEENNTFLYLLVLVLVAIEFTTTKLIFKSNQTSISSHFEI